MTTDLCGPSQTAYLGPVLEAAPRLLGMLDREPLSPTWGSFDRDHWAWKFRDFPVGMLQGGVLPLAWLWGTPLAGSPWAGSGRLRGWILGSLDHLLRRQHRNGAFDGVGPHTQDHGVTLAHCHTLATTARLLGEACPAPLAERLSESLRRATAFASRSAEDYAFISNHHALFALAWLRAGRHLGDSALCDRADQEIAAIREHQSPDGWYAEYGGPDPGYESLGLQYLAEYERERPDEALSRSMDRSLEFLVHCIQPDGGVGGGHGSRHTVQWYPAGFELLSGRSRLARAIARFMEPRLPHAPVVTPRGVDAHNLPVLLYSYCLAAASRMAEPETGDRDPLPCEQEAPLRHFADSGLVVASTSRYFALCGLKKGGVLSAYRKRDQVLVHEDAGYVAESGGRRWSSALLGLTQSTTATAPGARCTAQFGLAARPVLTPGRFVILRILNLTLFRSRVVGAWIRRMIIAQLISGRQPGPLTLERQVTFLEDRIAVSDTLTGGGGRRWALWRPRGFTAVHMGSARYFHPRDLVDLPEPALGSAAEQLTMQGTVSLAFSVEFAPQPPGASGAP